MIFTNENGLVDETPCAGCGWPTCSCLCPADDLLFDTFNTTTFAAVPIGGEFIEGLTTVNKLATRIRPTLHQCKWVNARRAGGKLILMAEWEPVFIRSREV